MRTLDEDTYMLPFTESGLEIKKRLDIRASPWCNSSLIPQNIHGAGTTYSNQSTNSRWRSMILYHKSGHGRGGPLGRDRLEGLPDFPTPGRTSWWGVSGCAGDPYLWGQGAGGYPDGGEGVPSLGTVDSNPSLQFYRGLESDIPNVNPLAEFHEEINHLHVF